MYVELLFASLIHVARAGLRLDPAKEQDPGQVCLELSPVLQQE